MTERNILNPPPRQLPHSRSSGDTRGAAREIGIRGRSEGAPRRRTTRQLEWVKQSWLDAELPEVRDPRLADCLKRAAAEAVSLAWLTAYPCLVLPVLLEEKGWEARNYYQRQQWVNSWSQAILTELGWRSTTLGTESFGGFDVSWSESAIGCNRSESQCSAEVQRTQLS